MKKGIDSIDIRNFRGIENLKLEDLKRINILVGENNSGKTTVLEAVSFFQRPFDMVSHLQRISRKFGYRGSYYRKIKEMFNQNNVENPVEMEVVFEGESKLLKISRSEEKVLGNLNLKLEDFKMEKSLYQGLSDVILFEYIKDRMSKIDSDIANSRIDKKIDIFELAQNDNYNDYEKYLEENFEKHVNNMNLLKTTLNYEFGGEIKEYAINNVAKNISVDSSQKQFINMTYSNPLTYLVEDYSLEAIDEAIKSGNKAEITKILKIFDENISDFNYISSEEEIYITTDDERASMSISNYGDGLKKALVLISKIIESKDGIALIDELETGIHKEVIGKLFNQIIEKSDKYNAQIIATTHSREAVESLLENLEDNLDEIAIFRLESFNNRFYARRFSGEKAYDIIVENGGDLR